MTCHDARETFSAFLDEALAPDERRDVEVHLAGCPECRRELERLRQTIALLHRVAPARAPVGFVDRVTAAARPRPWYRRIAAVLFLPLSSKLPVEATALAMVALLAVYVFERTPELQQAAREPAPRPEESRRRQEPARLTDQLASREPAGRRPAPAVSAPAPRGEDRREAEIARDTQAAGPSPPVASTPPAASAPAPPTGASPPAPARSETAPSPPAGRSPAAGVPPTSKSEASREPKLESGARADAERRQKAAELAGRALGASPAAPRLAAKRAAPADVIARVVVKDRGAAERDLAQLIARVGGTEAQRREEDESTVVEALIPQARYAEFSESLAGIGPWQLEAQRSDLPAQVRVILRLK